jgi:hypothetical protein
MKRILIAVLLVAGCGGGGLERPEIRTFGDLCLAVADAMCSRGDECGLLDDLGSDYDGCTNAVVASCCTEEGTCQAPPAAEPGEVYKCTDDLATFSCESLRADDVPASCLVI